MQSQTIITFPQDNNTWRIDWLGDISYQRHYRYSQPFINVALSKVNLSSPDHWEYTSSHPSFEEQKHAIVPIGTLSMLITGSIWKNGQLKFTPQYTHETFTITVNQSTSSLIKAGIEDKDGNFLLPFEYHPYHRSHTHSYCVKLQLHDGTQLLIPSAELVRFYFGSSSKLLESLFLAPFQESRLWSKSEISDTGHAKIELAKGISGVSAAHIARIAFNPCALHAAKLISSSLQAATGERQKKAYLKTHFPFNGTSPLKVKGIWLGSGSRKTFLVFEILSCLHPLPFTTLQYSMVSKAKTNESNPSSEKKDFPIKKQHQWALSRVLMSIAPDRQKASRQINYLSQSKFPDLDRKNVSRIDQLSPVRVVITDSGEISAACSIGEGEGKTGIQPVDLIPVECPSMLKGHPLAGSDFAAYVEEIIRKLSMQHILVRFVPLDSRQRYPQFSVMPEIVKEDGEIHPISYIAKEGKIRPRYISILRVLDKSSTLGEIWLILEHIATKGRFEPMIFPAHGTDTINVKWISNAMRPYILNSLTYM